jgi:hypothetical protein
MSIVVLLDIDGVILPDGMDSHQMSATAIALVNRLCTETGGKIVVVSSWRKMEDDTVAILTRAGIAADHFHTDPEAPHWFGSTRSEEINGWLSAHPEVQRLVLLDDAPCKDGNLEAVRVRCNSAIGLTEADYLTARKYLGCP